MRLAPAEYWNRQAASYDALYQSPWSHAENDYVLQRLKRLRIPRGATVLDLGCGTGLGLHLLERAGVSCKYVGVDISHQMLTHFHVPSNTRSAVTLVHCDVADYVPPHSETPTLIMSLFGSLSFSPARWIALERLTGAQRRGGRLHLMLLARYSLRRLSKMQISPTAEYSTRGSASEHSVTAYFDTGRAMRDNLKRLGYAVDATYGDGPIAGVLERRTFWGYSQYIGSHTTTLSHMITLEAIKR
jgi:SAM-dependent methyltransferase